MKWDTVRCPYDNRLMEGHAWLEVQGCYGRFLCEVQARIQASFTFTDRPIPDAVRKACNYGRDLLSSRLGVCARADHGDAVAEVVAVDAYLSFEGAAEGEGFSDWWERVAVHDPELSAVALDLSRGIAERAWYAALRASGAASDARKTDGET